VCSYKSGHRWENNIEVVLKMIFEDVVWIYLAQDRDKSWELVITVI
jgi:hypothetical protein